MTRKLFLYCTLSICLFILPSFLEKEVFMVPGLDAPQAIGAYLNNVFPSTLQTSLTTENAFPNLTFYEPTQIIKYPGQNKLTVACKNGIIWIFNNDPAVTTKTAFLDITAKVKDFNDGGLLSFVYHPEFGVPASPNRGYLYVWYRYIPNQAHTGDEAYMRLSRFTLADGASTILSSSEYVLIQQYDRQNWHNGGQLNFGADGFLYFSIGDEGGSNDQYNVTQQTDKFFYGGVHRIDVNQSGVNSHTIRKQPTMQATPPSGWPNSYTQGYYIPNDNPWLDVAGTKLEEFYALGVRSPYRMSIDAITGNIFVADVGDGTQEEIDIIEKGGNYQWPYMEGVANGPKTKPATLIGTDKTPLYTYARSVGTCIIGGFVYRGSMFPSLVGKYIYGDYTAKNISYLNIGSGTSSTATYLFPVPAVGTGDQAKLTSFGTDDQGNIFFSSMFNFNSDGGKIFKFKASGGSTTLPATLSATNAFTNLATLTPAPGIIPFDVNTPLWSDGAAKQRWVAIPNDGSHNTTAEKIIFSEEGNWVFPAGTVLIKHFDLPVNANNPSLVKRVETRFIILGANNSAYGITYKWNDEGTEAYLLPGADTRVIPVTEADGSVRNQTWTFPSRSDCFTCHTSNSNFVLGMKTRQLNKEILYPTTGRISNQIETFSSLGIFDQTIANTSLLPKSVSLDDLFATTEHKIRSYIDANCSSCHRPNGVTAAFDARSMTALHDQNMINATVQSQASVPGSIVVKPGDILNSEIHKRDASLAPNQMPPLAKSINDAAYLSTLTNWINGLPSTSPSVMTTARYRIKSKACSKVLDVTGSSATSGAPVILFTNNNTTNQQWDIAQVGNKKHTLAAAHSTLLLSAPNMLIQNGLQLVQESVSTKQDNYWYFEATGTGSYKIKNAYNGFCLGIADTANNTPVLFMSPASSSYQEWEITTVPGAPCQTTVYLSDLTWTSSTNGWGPVEKDRSNGETGAADGRTITLNGVTYTKGLGAHANSVITYALNGQYLQFKSDIGLDDEVTSGSVIFKVYKDNVVSYTSATMNYNSTTINLNIDVTGVNVLKLEVTDAGNGNGSDHADWANAHLTKNCGTTPVVTNVSLEAECGILGSNWSNLTNTGASNGRYVVVPTSSSVSSSLNSAPTSTASHLVYNFSVTQAGNYKVYLRNKVPNSSQDSYWVRMNGGTWIKNNNIPLSSSSFSWNQVHNSDASGANVTFPVVAGNNTLTIALRDKGTQLDKIYITLNGSIPSGAGTSATNCSTSIAGLTSNQSSIREMEQEYRLNLFPNPASDEVTLTWPNVNPGVCNIQIMDIGGRIVRKFNADRELGGTTFRLHDLNDGNYTIFVFAKDDITYTKKLLVHKK